MLSAIKRVRGLVVGGAGLFHGLHRVGVTGGGLFGVGLSGYNFDGDTTVVVGAVPELSVAVVAPCPGVSVGV